MVISREGVSVALGRLAPNKVGIQLRLLEFGGTSVSGRIFGDGGGGGSTRSHVKCCEMEVKASLSVALVIEERDILIHFLRLFYHLLQLFNLDHGLLCSKLAPCFLNRHFLCKELLLRTLCKLTLYWCCLTRLQRKINGFFDT
jgi:hypothetical protein